MNAIFYLLVLIPCLVGGWNGVPTHEGVMREDVVNVPAAGLTVGLTVNVTAGQRTYEGKVETVEKGWARVRADVPDGEVVIQAPTEEAMAAIGLGALDGAKAAVDLAISLVGTMTLFLGLVKVVEVAGGMQALARWIRPVMVKLFPDVPADHPAMSAMIMNLAANVLGLGNAATPFGVKAMQELESLNPKPGTATNAMVLFLAVNTAGVAVLPTGVIAIRAGLKSVDPASIFLPTLVCSVFTTMGAILVTKALQNVFPVERHKVEASPIRLVEFVPLLLALGAFIGFVVAAQVYGTAITSWIMPGLIVGMLTIGVACRVKVYEVFIDGAKDGFNTAMRIVPFVVAILAAVGMFQASGAMGRLVMFASPLCRFIGMPPEVLPLAILRPLSGSGSMALTAELTRIHGPDTFIGVVAGTLNGSTETTFYVLALYFGAVGINKYRHAVLVGLATDVIGALCSVWAVKLLLDW